jgi:hypothetical protein
MFLRHFQRHFRKKICADHCVFPDPFIPLIQHLLSLIARQLPTALFFSFETSQWSHLLKIGPTSSRLIA